MEKEELYQRFMDFAESYYDSLAYAFQFSQWKRIRIDRERYLNLAKIFFEDRYQNLSDLHWEQSLSKLIIDFQEEVEIFEYKS